LSEIRDARAAHRRTIVPRRWSGWSWGRIPRRRLSSKNLQRSTPTTARCSHAVRFVRCERRRGVWTISAGNAGQVCPYAARARGVPSRRRHRDGAALSSTHARAGREARARTIWGRLAASTTVRIPRRRDVYPSFEIRTSSPVTRPMGLEILEDHRTVAINRRRRVAPDHRRGQCRESLRPEIKVGAPSGDCRACRTLSPKVAQEFRNGSTRRRPEEERVSAHVQRMQPVVDGFIV